MIDLLLVMTLGFLGSFGHCVGMCGPLTAAFSLPGLQEQPKSHWQQFVFHCCLNLGRVLSYALVGASLGAVGSVLIASGQMAGIGSSLRRGVALLMGLLLIWLGLMQVAPTLLPRLPLLHPLAQQPLHERLSRLMIRVSGQFSTRRQSRTHALTPFLLGSLWGLVPCGFLYTAQIKAAETGSAGQGAATMLAFGLGTLPTMLGIGISTARLSGDQRSQLYRLGGWVTLAIGVLTLLRTGEMMTDYTGHAALVGLLLALSARPLSQVWAAPLRYRRILGVGSFVLAAAHTLHMVEHSWGWKLEAIWFMLPQHQWSILAGAIALLLLLPVALTSFDQAQKRLGSAWRSLHLLTVPALVLSGGHAIFIGSHYLGALQQSKWQQASTALLVLSLLVVLLLRCRWFWKIFALEKFYASPFQPKSTRH